jgi:hypothetical protein
MGDWGNAPWGNDEAADWFGMLFDQNRIAEFVRETLLDAKTSYTCVRAAASILIFLGRPYTWPPQLDEDLRLALNRLEKIVLDPDAEEYLSVDAVRGEIAILRTRLNRKEDFDDEVLAKSAWDALR